MIHGCIAAVVVFLLWIYVSAVILLFGVEMTAAYVRLQAADKAPGSVHPARSREGRIGVGDRVRG